MERLKQPAILGYILAGVVLGSALPDSYLPDRDIFNLAGEAGLILLLFFIGSEVSFDSLIRKWKVSLLGTTLQIALITGVCFLLGKAFDWSASQSLFFGFALSLSSSAVVIKILDEFGGARSIIGSYSVGILVVQDLAFVPLLIALSFVGGKELAPELLARQGLGAIIVIALSAFLLKKHRIPLPRWILNAQNREFQFFTAILFALGASALTSWLHLSPAFGAFLAGMILSGTDKGESFRRYLDPLRVLLMAVFFLSVGFLFDLSFIQKHISEVLLLSLGILVLKTALLSLTLILLKIGFITSIVTGCLLAQVGEFSFLLSAVALGTNIIDPTTYQMMISVIVMTLALTPFWLSLSRKIMRRGLGESGTIAFKVSDLQG